MADERRESDEPQKGIAISLGLAAGLLFCVLVLILVQVFARYLGLSPTWTEEMVRWVWAWVACLGLGEVERNNEHVCMNYLAEKLAPQARLYLFMLFDLTALLVAIVLIWLAWKSIRINSDTFAATVPISRGFFYASFLVGSVLVAYHALLKLVKKIRRRYHQERVVTTPERG